MVFLKGAMAMSVGDNPAPSPVPEEPPKIYT